MTKPVRVLVVDDSAFARKVLREVLTTDRRIEVIGFARDGVDALEKIDTMSPDVITLDLVMPQLDGVGVLDALGTKTAPPRVVVVTMSDSDGPLGVAALQAGAFDIVQKPTALATDRLYELGGELIEKVVAAAGAPARRYAKPAARPVAPPVSTSDRVKLVAIGASTGGPRAIAALLASLPAGFPVPIAIVVHMPVGYTEAFATRLDKECAIQVLEASQGLELVPGRAVIARAGMHLAVRKDQASLVCVLDREPADAIHRPCVDVLFATAADALGPGVLGVVLTGMGVDGLAGARVVHEKDGRILTESAESCVVYGMPRAVAEANLSDAAVPIERMALAILDRL